MLVSDKRLNAVLTFHFPRAVLRAWERCSHNTMPERVLAATTIGAFKTEIREYPFPEIPPDAGILKIEAAGVCDNDWQAYQHEGPPRIMGHENVGRI